MTRNLKMLVPSLTTIYRILKKDYSLEEKSHRSIKNKTLNCSQPAFTTSKPTIKTIEQCVKSA